MGNGEKCPYTPEQIYGKTNFDGERDICGLEVHARNELDLFMKRLREEDEKQGKVADPEMYEMQELMHDSVMHIIKAFCDCDFSGGVAGYALNLFKKLVNWDPINYITTDPDEWNDVTWDEETGIRTYQAKRCSRLFRDSDDPDNIAHIVDGYVFDCDFHGSYTTGGGLNRKNHPDIVLCLENLLEIPIVSSKDIELPEIKFESTRVHLDEFQYQMRDELITLYNVIREIMANDPPKSTMGRSAPELCTFAYQKVANRIIVVDERYVCFVYMGTRSDEHRNTLYDPNTAKVIAVADWGEYYYPIDDYENKNPFTQYFNRLLPPYTTDDRGKDSRSTRMLPMISFVSYASDDHAPTHVIPLMMPKKNFRYYSTVVTDHLGGNLMNIVLDNKTEKDRYADYHIDLFSLLDNSDMIMIYTKRDADGNSVCDDRGYPLMNPEKTVLLVPQAKGVDDNFFYVYKAMPTLVIPEDEFELWSNKELIPAVIASSNRNDEFRKEIRRRFYEKHPDRNPQYVEASDGENCHCCGDVCDDTCCGC